MKKCDLTITSVVDGQENQFSTEGKLELSLNGPKICYREDPAYIRILFRGETAKIEREGDYSLRLFLERGVTHEGYIGIGGNEGSIQTRTEKISYSVGKDSLLASLHYKLVIGTETQNMRLRILARVKE